MEKQFTFSFLESGFKLDTEKTELLMKWGLDRSLNCHKWTFDQQFQQYEANNFLNCLFRDSSVANALGYAGLVSKLCHILEILFFISVIERLFSAEFVR